MRFDTQVVQNVVAGASHFWACGRFPSGYGWGMSSCVVTRAQEGKRPTSGEVRRGERPIRTVRTGSDELTDGQTRRATRSRWRSRYLRAERQEDASQPEGGCMQDGSPAGMYAECMQIFFDQR